MYFKFSNIRIECQRIIILIEWFSVVLSILIETTIMYLFAQSNLYHAVIRIENYRVSENYRNTLTYLEWIEITYYTSGNT